MNKSETEPRLIEMINGCDPEGYKRLCENYSAILYGQIIRMVNDTGTAENLLKDTFQKVCKNIDQYSHSQLTFLTWILQLARSASIDYLYTAHQNINEDGPLNIELTLITAQGEAAYEMEVFEMIQQGYKVIEIAEKLNLPVETVKMNIRKGMKLKANRS